MNRHVDTAKYYNNEKDVGEAVRECGLKRDEVFVTSKIWLTDFGYKRTQKVGHAVQAVIFMPRVCTVSTIAF